MSIDKILLSIDNKARKAKRKIDLQKRYKKPKAKLWDKHKFKYSASPGDIFIRNNKYGTFEAHAT